MGAQESAITRPSNLPVTEARFMINGKNYIVNADGQIITATTTLNWYIRNVAELKGTKAMCLEGGCGSCVVAAEIINPNTRKKQLLAVNSCLVTVLSCEGWNITTIEGIGNQKEGYHVIQNTLAEFNGTQCGFCSPGFVMSMYTYYETNENLSPQDIEKSFGGNICRCTGYRPICDAFKSLTSNDQIEDIENLNHCLKHRLKTSDEDEEPFDIIEPLLEEIPKVFIDTENQKWYRVTTLGQVLEVLRRIGDAKYMLVAGNTATGVARRDPNIEVFIDINNVAELREISVGNQVSVGANTSIAETVVLFKKIAKDKPQFLYLKDIAEHYELVANNPVRNIGTLAGNLMLKHDHRRFQSDVFLTLETFNAKLKIADKFRILPKFLSPKEFLDFDMKGKVITNILLNPLTGNHIYKTYKIMPRAQNAPAIINAGFRFQMSNDITTVLNATIVYGNINTEFTHASNTEKYFINKKLFDDAVLQQAYQVLNTELKVDTKLPEAPPDQRRQLAIGLFYKFILATAPSNKMNSRNQSGGVQIQRPLSMGKQTYETHPDEYPLTKPIPKLEAYTQTAGEAKYIVDFDVARGDFTFGAFILADAIVGSTIKSINTKKAMDTFGVIAIYTASDIPGENNCVPHRSLLIFTNPEEIFCSGVVKYNGQAIGILLAKTEEIANRAVKLVEVQYDSPKSGAPPVLNTRDAIDIPNNPRIQETKSVKREKRGNDVKKVIRGELNLGSQYHYTLETQACVVVPIEDGLNVYSSTQWINLVQKSISACCAIPEKNINIEVRRLGSGYGAKLTRSNLIACATAIAAVNLGQPVYVRMTIEDNTKCIGKRHPFSTDYEVGVDAKGKIQYCNLSYYSNYGYLAVDDIEELVYGSLTNLYDLSFWEIKGYSVLTDSSANAYTRAPGGLEAFAITETLMAHIATEMNLDPSDVRLQNLKPDDESLPKIISDFRKERDIEERQKSIDNFNKNNRWKKRGISVAVMSFPVSYLYPFTALVSIYANDGSVVITHGGIEMGQGLNTKAAQVAAYILGIDLSYISVKPSRNVTAPNNFNTGGSIGSDAIAFAVKKACEVLVSRINPVKEKLTNPTWIQTTQACDDQFVNLSVTYTFTDKDTEMKPYPVYGVSFAEVEVDILTGQTEVKRVDLLVDAGESLSPEVDVGQVEGAYMTGLGYWLTEEVILSPKSGAVLTNRTWNYHPPTMMDTPTDWRVELRKNSSNNNGVLRSKATGEPSICVSVAIPLAIRLALESARKEGDPSAPSWIPFDGPTTVAATLRYSLPNYSQYKLS